MTENPRTVPGPYHDDVQGHGLRWGADAEKPESDTEGHAGRYNFADAESAEGDNTEAHAMRSGRGADAESAEGDGDTEGHGGRYYADAEQVEGGDTTGHAIRFNANETVDVDDDDTEGHGKRLADAESAEGDVSGHSYVADRDELNGQRER